MGICLRWDPLAEVPRISGHVRGTLIAQLNTDVNLDNLSLWKPKKQKGK